MAGVKESLADLQIGIASLAAGPQSLGIGKRYSKETADGNYPGETGYNRPQPRPTVEISLNLLNLFADDTPKGFEGKNKGQIKTAGLHPGWRDDSGSTPTLLHI